MDLFAAAGALALGIRLLVQRRRAHLASLAKTDETESIVALQPVARRQLEGMTVVVTGGASGSTVAV